MSEILKVRSVILNLFFSSKVLIKPKAEVFTYSRSVTSDLLIELSIFLLLFDLSSKSLFIFLIFKIP